MARRRRWWWWPAAAAVKCLHTRTANLAWWHLAADQTDTRGQWTRTQEQLSGQPDHPEVPGHTQTGPHQHTDTRSQPLDHPASGRTPRPNRDRRLPGSSHLESVDHEPEWQKGGQRGQCSSSKHQLFGRDVTAEHGSLRPRLCEPPLFPLSPHFPACAAAVTATPAQTTHTHTRSSLSLRSQEGVAGPDPGTRPPCSSSTPVSLGNAQELPTFLLR